MNTTVERIRVRAAQCWMAPISSIFIKKENIHLEKLTVEYSAGTKVFKTFSIEDVTKQKCLNAILKKLNSAFIIRRRMTKLP